jgi:multidrug efflux pump subunit AcrA (membrane-fusion protein)
MKSFFSKFWSGTKTRVRKSGTYVRKHKIFAGVVILVIIGVGYWGYTALAADSTTSEYTLTAATSGPLQVTVTGSGQVDSEDTLNVTPQGSASGQITAIHVTAGEKVTAGTAIAQLDDTTAAEAVTSARQDLESAEISYEQTQTSSKTSLTNDQTSIGTELSTTYTGLPAIMTGLDGILHNLSTISEHTAQENIQAYESYIPTAEAEADETKVANDYATAETEYQAAQQQYTAAGPMSSLTTAQLQQLAATTITATQDINTALSDTLTYYNYIDSQATASGITVPSQLV